MKYGKVVLSTASGEKRSCSLDDLEITIGFDGVISLTTPFSRTRECLLNSAEMDEIRRAEHA